MGSRRVGWHQFWVVVVTSALAACASGGEKPNPQRSSITQPLQYESSRADEINLVSLIDPENRRTLLAGGDCAMAEINIGKRDDALRQRARVHQLECALTAFKTYTISYDDFIKRGGRGDTEERYAAAAQSLALALRRNDIQDRMLVRSDALCRDFQRRLNIDLTIENDTNLSNFMRNSQVQLVKSVGSLFIGGDALWALSSAARITDLPGYVHDEGQIERNMMQLAMIGLAQRRTDMFSAIDRKRRAPVRHGGLSLNSSTTGDGITPVAVYSLERAIGDALQYHNACSVNEGLGYAVKVLTDRAGSSAPMMRFPDLVPSAVNP